MSKADNSQSRTLGSKKSLAERWNDSVVENNFLYSLGDSKYRKLKLKNLKTKATEGTEVFFWPTLMIAAKSFDEGKKLAKELQKEGVFTLSQVNDGINTSIGIDDIKENSKGYQLYKSTLESISSSGPKYIFSFTQYNNKNGDIKQRQVIGDVQYSQTSNFSLNDLENILSVVKSSKKIKIKKVQKVKNGTPKKSQAKKTAAKTKKRTFYDRVKAAIKLSQKGEKRYVNIGNGAANDASVQKKRAEGVELPFTVKDKESEYTLTLVVNKTTTLKKALEEMAQNDSLVGSVEDYMNAYTQARELLKTTKQPKPAVTVSSPSTVSPRTGVNLSAIKQSIPQFNTL